MAFGSALFRLDVKQPDNEQEQNHDRADIDDDLQEADRDRAQAHEKNAHVDKDEGQREDAVNSVTLQNYAQGGNDRQRREEEKEPDRHCLFRSRRDDDEGRHDQIGESDGDETLPSEAHELVIAEAWQRPSNEDLEPA